MSFYPVLPPLETIYKKKTKKKCSLQEIDTFLSETIVRNQTTDFESLSPMGFDHFELQKKQAQIAMATDEIHWNNCGRKVIFLESKEFVRSILNSKFDTETITNLQPIADSFYLVLPKGVTDEYGNELTNTIVSWDLQSEKADSRNRNIITKAHTKLGYDDPQMNDINELIEGNEDILQAFNEYIVGEEGARENFKEQQILNLYLHGDSIGMVTKAIYEPNFADALHQKNSAGLNGLVNSMFKLILGLAIYINAGGEIKDGFPAKRALVNNARRAIEPASKQGFKMKFISFAKEMRIQTGGFVRGFHFRNLRADRYYKGEYSDLPKGSRWVFVSPCWVGERIDPKTATGVSPDE